MRQKFIGTAFRIAPRLSARLASRIFLTTRRRAPRPEQERLLAAASSLRVPSGGRTLRGYSWGEGPAVLLVHGWNGSAAQLTPLVAPLLARGLRVVALDGPGHGASPGRVSHVGQIAEAVGALMDQLPEVRGLVAHSAGALAVARVLAARGEVLPVAFIAPAVRMDVFADGFARALRLRRPQRALFRAALERRTGVRIEDLDLRRLAPRLPAPSLLVADPADELIPIDEARALARLWAGSSVLEHAGGGHYRIVRDPAVARAVADFIHAAVAGLAASGQGAPDRRAA